MRKHPPKRRRPTPQRHERPWQSLQPGANVRRSQQQKDEMVAHFRKLDPNLSKAAARRYIDESENAEVWLNDQYVVQVFSIEANSAFPFLLVHLSIRRQDRQAVHDWRHFQIIKNELVGAACEGVELYPAEDRLADCANQYHLYVVADPKFRFPWGFTERFVTGESGGGATQRPLPKCPPVTGKNGMAAG